MTPRRTRPRALAAAGGAALLLALPAPGLLAAAAAGTASTAPSRDPALPPPRAVSAAVQEFRLALGLYRWRIKTTMTVDGSVRILKVEDVRLGPDGNLVREKTLRWERKPLPTPYSYGDPRRSLPDPPSQKEEDGLWDTALSVLSFYLRVAPDRVADWSARCRVLARDPDRDGAVRWQARGLVRPWDDAAAYFDPATRALRLVEVKTTASFDRLVDITFLRIAFGTRPALRSGQPPATVIEDIFLNMSRGSRRVVVQIEATDYRGFS